MRNNARANVELVAQVVIAIAVVVATVVLVKRAVFPGQANLARPPRISVGEQLNLANIDWKQNKKSLVFFLKKDCPYCTASAAFYRQLIEEAGKRNVTSVAVLPDAPDEARKYIRYLELPIDKLEISPLAAYKISGTPTVLFVDESGIVKGAWFGASPQQEKEMRDSLVALFELGTSDRALKK